MKKYIKLLLSLMLISLVMLNVGCSKYKIKIKPTETLSDQDQKIEVTTPKGYEVFTNEEFILSIGNNLEKRYVDISVEYKKDLIDNLSLEDYAKNTIAYWEKEFNLEVLEEEKVDLNGDEVIWLINTFKTEGVNKKAITYLIETEDAFYILDAHTKDTIFYNAKDEFTTILNSFQVKKVSTKETEK